MSGADSTGDKGVDVPAARGPRLVIIIGAGGLTAATGLQTHGSTINGATVNVTKGRRTPPCTGYGGNIFTDNTWNGAAGVGCPPPRATSTRVSGRRCLAA